MLRILDGIGRHRIGRGLLKRLPTVQIAVSPSSITGATTGATGTVTRTPKDVNGKPTADRNWMFSDNPAAVAVDKYSGAYEVVDQTLLPANLSAQLALPDTAPAYNPAADLLVIDDDLSSYTDLSAMAEAEPNPYKIRPAGLWRDSTPIDPSKWAFVPGPNGNAQAIEIKYSGTNQESLPLYAFQALAFSNVGTSHLPQNEVDPSPWDALTTRISFYSRLSQVPGTGAEMQAFIKFLEAWHRDVGSNAVRYEWDTHNDVPGQSPPLGPPGVVVAQGIDNAGVLQGPNNATQVYGPTVTDMMLSGDWYFNTMEYRPHSFDPGTVTITGLAEGSAAGHAVFSLTQAGKLANGQIFSIDVPFLAYAVVSNFDGDRTCDLTFWEVLDSRSSATIAEQPLTVGFNTTQDGFARRWIDGKLVQQVSKASIGVTPLGAGKPWASAFDLATIMISNGIRFLSFGDAYTGATGYPFNLAIAHPKMWIVNGL